MVYSDSPYHPALVELARAGNLRAIAHWLNQILLPHGLRALVGAARPGCLKILVEVPPSQDQDERSPGWRNAVVRLVCHRIWKLNSASIEGVRIAARLAGERSLLWEQSVKIASPARRYRRHQSQQLRTRIRQTARQKARLKTARTLVMSGSTVAAFVCGGVIAFVKAPVDESNAVPSPKLTPATNPPRPKTVRAALESVEVVKHTEVANPNDPTATLMFAGDVTLSDYFPEAIGSDTEWAFAALDEYRQADLAMVNLENPLTKATLPLPDKQFNFKAEPDFAAKILKAGGIDVVSLANNHAMDYQAAGLQETVDTLDRAGIEFVGAGRNVQAARRPEIIDVKGQRIAYLGYYGADFHAATDTDAGTNYADEARIAQDIQAIRSQVDWIVVNYHWGEELATHPAQWQIDLAHFTIDQGADLVVGHHPHVLQGAEVYKGRPIAYSLGNFIFGGNPRTDYDTAVLKVSVKDKQMKAEFLPVEVRKYQPRVISGDRGNKILQHLADISSGFQQPLRSPAILEARSPTPLVPSSPVDLTVPATPADSPSLPSPSPTPTDSVVPATPAVEEPAVQSPSPTPTPNSFTDSDLNTPFNSTSPGTWSTQPNEPTTPSPAPETVAPTSEPSIDPGAIDPTSPDATSDESTLTDPAPADSETTDSETTDSTDPLNATPSVQ